MATWVDVVYTLFGNIHLVSANARYGGKYLPVDIGEANAVVVYDVECAHAASRQYLNHIASHASYAKYRYT